MASRERVDPTVTNVAGLRKARAALGLPEAVRQLRLWLEHYRPLSREHVAQQLTSLNRGAVGPPLTDW